jgi:hypothetical protein
VLPGAALVELHGHCFFLEGLVLFAFRATVEPDRVLPCGLAMTKRSSQTFKWEGDNDTLTSHIGLGFHTAENEHGVRQPHFISSHMHNHMNIPHYSVTYVYSKAYSH